MIVVLFNLYLKGWVHTIVKGISLKVNVSVWLEFEPVYYHVAETPQLRGWFNAETIPVEQ